MIAAGQNKRIFINSALALLFFLFLLAYSGTVEQILGIWSKFDQAYAHGYLVLAVSVYFFYEDRDKIFRRYQEVSTGYLISVLLLIIIFSAIWFVAYSIQIQIIQFASLIVLMWLWLSGVFGKSSAISSIVPIGLFFMVIPVWGELSVYLQALTVFINHVVLSWFGISAYFEGNFIHLADGVIEIAEGCSGLNTFLAGTTLGIIYAEMNFVTLRRKAAVVLMAIFVSLFVNWIRVISLILIADYSKMQNSLVKDHVTYGWIIFSICFILFFIAASKLDPGKNKEKDPGVGNDSINNPKAGQDSSLKRAFIVTLVIMIFPVYSWSLKGMANNQLLSHQLINDNAIKQNKVEWLPGFANYDEVNSWREYKDEVPVDITVISYKDQQQGKELIYYRNKLNGNGEKLDQVEKVGLVEKTTINKGVISNKKGQRLVYWYYQIGGFQASEPYMAKLLQIPANIQKTPIASLVTISIECDSEDCSKQASLLSVEDVRQIIESIQIVKDKKG